MGLLHKEVYRADDVVEPFEVVAEADRSPNDLALAILNYFVVATFLMIYFMMMMLVNYRQKSENKDVMTQKMSEKL